MTGQDQLDFEGKTYVRREGPQTSRDAAFAAEVVRTAKSDEGQIYRLILDSPRGLTNDELSSLLEGYGGRIIPPNQVASRTKTLRDRGLVRWSGEQRETRRGRMAGVLVAVDR